MRLTMEVHHLRHHARVAGGNVPAVDVTFHVEKAPNAGSRSEIGLRATLKRSATGQRELK